MRTSATSCSRFARVALETAAQQAADRARCSRGQLAERDLGPQDGGERFGHGVAVEHPLAGEHLEQQHPERPNVRTLVDRQPLGLLG